MDLTTAIKRAKRALRDDLKLYLVAVSSLTVAFLCLSAALLVLGNLALVAEQWGQSRRMSVYLVDGARQDDVERLSVLLEGLPDVESVEHVTSVAAREQFLESARVEGDLSGVSPDVFPASLEVGLSGDVTIQRMEDIAIRAERIGAVEDIETYSGWFGKLDALLTTGRAVSGILAFLVMVCVLAVIANTIRLAIAGRRDEIEVLKLCGATDSFVRMPFVVEGVFQGFASSMLAVLFLLAGFLVLREQLDGSLAALTGTRAVFLGPVTILAIVCGGACIGAVGSVMSLKRYLAV